MNPYQHSEITPPGQDALPIGQRLAGNAEAALKLADLQRQEYYNKLAGTSWTRGTFGFLAVALSGWAVHSALKPGAMPDGSAAAADKRRSARLAATVASIYTLRELFVNPGQEREFAEAYLSLTCMMLESAPLLMTEQTAGGPAGSLDVLRMDIITLKSRLDELSASSAMTRASVEAFERDKKDMKAAVKPLRDQLDRTDRALLYARNAYYDAGRLVATVEQAGYRIRTGSALAVSVANLAVQREQADVSGKTQIASMDDLATQVLNIGADAAADQAEGAGAAGSVGGDAKTSGVGGRAFDAFAASPREHFVATDWRPAQTAQAPKPAKPAKPRPPTTASAASGVLSLDDLKALKEKLTTAITSEERRQADAKSEAQVGALEARLKVLRGEVDDKAATEAKGLQCGQVTGAMSCAEGLAKSTEALYAVRRPVVQALLNFRQIARDVADPPVCIERKALRVTPNNVIRTRPGETVTLFVAQRAVQNPLVALHGESEGDAGAKLTFEALMGTNMSRASIKIGTRMPPQKLFVVFSDHHGSAGLRIPIVVGGRLNPLDPPESPASAASAPGKAAPSPA